eukprot:4326018-Alexandrium_andersonii.AAC.1
MEVWRAVVGIPRWGHGLPVRTGPAPDAAVVGCIAQHHKFAGEGVLHPSGGLLFVKSLFLGREAWVAVAGGSPLRALAMPVSGLGFVLHPGGSWTR